jgi:hypothetical protein
MAWLHRSVQANPTPRRAGVLATVYALAVHGTRVFPPLSPTAECEVLKSR